MEDDPSNISLLPSFHSVPFVQWVSCFLWMPLSAFTIISLAFPNWQASGSCQSVFLCVFTYHWRRNMAKGETPSKSPPRLRQSNVSRIVLFLHGNGHFSLPLPIWKILSILYVQGGRKRHDDDWGWAAIAVSLDLEAAWLVCCLFTSC